MADIYHYFQIKDCIENVFEKVSTPKGLEMWWSESSFGNSAIKAIYQLDFGPGYKWKAAVSKYEPFSEFELTMIEADSDWLNSKVGFRLKTYGSKTGVQFYHTGWREDNEHYRISCYCWAMYLRILKRHLEFGEFVPYSERLSV